MYHISSVSPEFIEDITYWSLSFVDTMY